MLSVGADSILPISVLALWVFLGGLAFHKVQARFTAVHMLRGGLAICAVGLIVAASVGLWSAGFLLGLGLGVGVGVFMASGGTYLLGSVPAEGRRACSFPARVGGWCSAGVGGRSVGFVRWNGMCLASGWRMLGGDGFFVILAGFELCMSTVMICAWRLVGWRSLRKHVEQGGGPACGGRPCFWWMVSRRVAATGCLGRGRCC